MRYNNISNASKKVLQNFLGRNEACLCTTFAKCAEAQEKSCATTAVEPEGRMAEDAKAVMGWGRNLALIVWERILDFPRQKEVSK